jgi:hypothetical protein
MKEPGSRFLAAKRPLCPCAGWVGVVMGVMRTRRLGPKAVLGGIEVGEAGRVRRADSSGWVREGE